jgi:transposase
VHERAVGDRRELWRAIDPLLPPEPPKPQGGRYRVPDRACLTGIIFVLKSELPREHLPREDGCGSGVTCWRRLRDWQRVGVWEQLHNIGAIRRQSYHGSWIIRVPADVMRIVC